MISLGVSNIGLWIAISIFKELNRITNIWEINLRKDCCSELLLVKKLSESTYFSRQENILHQSGD